MGEEEGGGGGDDEHGDDDDAADGFEGGDGGDRDHDHEEVVQELGGEAEGVGEAGVEGAEAEFFEEGDDDDEVEKEGDPGYHGSARVKVAEEFDGIEGGEFDGSVENATGIEIDFVGGGADENQSQGEQGGEDNAHSGTAVDVSEAADPLCEDGGENAHDGGSERTW